MKDKNLYIIILSSLGFSILFVLIDPWWTSSSQPYNFFDHVYQISL